MNKKKFWNIFKFTSYLAGTASILLKFNALFMKNKSKEVARTNDGTGENKVGYEGINVQKNTVVHTNNFVVLHVNRNMNVYLLKDKINFCKENNISFSLVLDTEAVTLLDIYQDIDFLQAIINDCGQIDMPIYCNIDNIMTNTSLNNNQKQEILGVFSEKMNLSKVYFGFYGTDTNLDDCNRYIMNITEQDCFLVQDKADVVYNGTCNIVKNIDGEILSKCDISNVIFNNSLNVAEDLVLSAIYVADVGDTYHSLALKFGLSEDDLRTYNNVTSEELHIGDKINIPNLYMTSENDEITYISNIFRGIDISDYQTDINWNRVKETSSFVIVEVSRDSTNYMENEGTYLDSAVRQIKDAIDNDIALGLYCCVSKDMDAKTYKERLERYFRQLENDLNENDVVLERENIPVFLDFEIYSSDNNYYELMKVFEKVCNEHGFTRIGIYGNKSTLTDIFSNMYDEDGSRVAFADTNWYVWKSGGEQYSANESTATPIHVDSIKEPTDDFLEINLSNGENIPVSVAQATNIGGETGAANHRGHCDVNFCVDGDVFGDSFVDYVNHPKIETLEYVGVSLDNYTDNSVNIPQVTNGVANSFVGLMGVVIGTDIIIKKKTRAKKR